MRCMRMLQVGLMKRSEKPHAKRMGSTEFRKPAEPIKKRAGICKIAGLEDV